MKSLHVVQKKNRGKKLNIRSAGIYINNHCKFNFITKYDVGILAAICGIAGENRPTGAKFPMEIIDL